MAQSRASAGHKASFLLNYALQSFGIVVLLAILIRTFLFASYVMGGASMLPTIWPGDFLVGSKWALNSLQRGDIAAIRCPQYKDRICLRRVIGISGDRVEFRQGKLMVNGVEAQYRQLSPDFQTEVVWGRSWTIWPSQTGIFEPVVLQPDQIYLLNDKRSDRDDSRTWGPVSADLIEAKAVRVWVSLDWYDGKQVRNWPRIRGDRILRGVD